MEYNIDILKRDTIIRLIDNFIHLVQSAVENPAVAVSELSLLSENDKKKLSEFNNTEVWVPDLLLHNLFEDQVKNDPSKTAVTEDRRQSYFHGS